jgi:hypothetical protein
MFQQLGMKG